MFTLFHCKQAPLLILGVFLLSFVVLANCFQFLMAKRIESQQAEFSTPYGAIYTCNK